MFKIEERIIFKQLQDKVSSTYTYILADPKTRDAVIIDPVDSTADRDIKLIKELDLNLKYVINTHVHADHITGSGKLKTEFKSTKSMISEASGAKADLFLKDGDKIQFGNEVLECLSTPGHTSGCMTFLNHKNQILFTGDALFIRGNGRTDFQGGSADLLYESVHTKLFVLPENFIVYPGHDYKGETSTTIGEEKKFNPRLSHSKTEFKKIMDNLDLPYPKMIDQALPINMVCGLE